MNIEKVAVIGLDCCEPSLVFDKWHDDLPNLRRLMRSGLHGNLESCLPPVTVPAWTCMTTGKDPGTLGVYGFRNRRDYNYDKLYTATSLDICEPKIWDIVGKAGKQAIIVGVPQTFPIVKPPNGCMVTDFLTPSTESDYTHPLTLKREIADLVGEYMVDVPEFRTDNKTRLCEQIHTMTDRRFEVCKHLLRTRRGTCSSWLKSGWIGYITASGGSWTPNIPATRRTIRMRTSFTTTTCTWTV